MVGYDFLVSSDDDWSAHHPSMACTPPGSIDPLWAGTIHTVWDEQNGSDLGIPAHSYEIHYSQSPGDSGGRAWSNDDPWEGDRILSSTVQEEPAGTMQGDYYSNDAVDPSVVVDYLGHVHVIWRQMYADGNWEIHYSKSTDNGLHWTGFDGADDPAVSFRRANGLDWRILDPPQIAVSNDASGGMAILHVIWTEYDYVGGMKEVFYSRSVDGGATWSGSSENLMLSGAATSAPASLPTLAAAGPNGEHVCVAWSQRFGADQDEIWAAVSHDFGVTWLPESCISKVGPDGLNAGAPALAGSQAGFIVTWPQPVEVAQPAEILYGLSSDGMAWTCAMADERLSFPDGNAASRPSVALSPSGMAYAAWNEGSVNPWGLSQEVHVSFSQTPSVSESWSGNNNDIVISTPDASSNDASANAGNVTVGFAHADGAWRPRAFWDEINYNSTMTRGGVYVDEWEIVSGMPTDYSVPVVEGWNLISVPMDQDYSDPETVFNDAAGDGNTTWDRLVWYDAADSQDRWKQYATGWNTTLNDLGEVDIGMGLWINITAVGDGYLTVTGLKPTSTTMNLKAGWNLVGYPADDDSSYNVASLKSATGATIVEGFKASATYKTEVLADGVCLKKGAGYWVYAPADTTWTVDW
jgi:hypothetical protein